MTRGVGGRGPANIMKHIKGIKFPADKSQILKVAKGNAGPDSSSALEVLDKIPEREYSSPAEILKEVGRIE